MTRGKGHLVRLIAVGVGLAALLAVSMACAAPAPTPTPVPPAPPAPPAQPTPVPTPTVALAPATPTPAPVAPTPTRALPTPTPVVTGKPVYGGTLRFGHRLDIDTFDPIFNNSASSYQAMYALYGGLFRIDEAANVLPSMAKSWEFSADGKTMTIRLEPGVKFHDGTPFNARAVKWNFDRMVDPKLVGSLRRAELQPFLAGVEVLDDTTLRLNLVNPFRPLLPQLATERMGFLTSPVAVEKYGGTREGNYGKNPMGAGPFRFDEWVLDNRLVLKRSDSYREKGKPYLDAIVMTSVLDPGTRLALLRTGETDFIYNAEVTGNDIPLVERSPELRLVRLEGASTYLFSFNPGKPPFNNRALRQAIAYALDRDKFIKAVFGGIGTPAYTLIPSGWAYNPDLKPIPFDLARARQKLAEAGYPQGTTVPIACRPAGVFYDMCEVLQALVKEAGINLEIRIMPVAGYFTFVTNTGYWRAVGFGSLNYAFRVDPHTLLQGTSHSKGVWNTVDGYNNPEVDRLIDEAATIYDTAKAKPLYDRIQTIVTEDALMIFAIRYTKLYPMNRRVRGFVPLPTGFEHLEFLWLER